MKFHINESGNVGSCSAAAGKCPFGGEEDHYPSVGIARAVYEEERGNSFAPAVGAAATLSSSALTSAAQETLELNGDLLNDPLSLKELNGAVKYTSDAAILNQAVEFGSERTLTNMARNHNADAVVLLAAYRKAKEDITREKLAYNPNFPLVEASGEVFAAGLRARKAASFKAYMDITKLNAIGDSHIRNLSMDEKLPFVRNGENQITPKAVAKIVAEGKYSYTAMDAALASGKFKIADHTEKLTCSSFRGVVDRIKSPEDLAALGEMAVRESQEGRSIDAEQTKWLVARNINTPSATIHSMAENGGSVDVLMSAYRNPNASAATKALAASKSSAVESFAKIEKLNEVHGGELGKLMKGSADSPPPNYHSQQRTVNFDPQAVKDLGMSPADVDTYVRYVTGNSLFNAKYSEGSGAYTGYID